MADMPPVVLPHLAASYRSSRAPAFVAMLLPAWCAGAMLPGFFNVSRDLPLAAGGPSLWALVDAIAWFRDLPLTGLALAAALGVAASLIAHVAIQPPRRDRAWTIALLAALVLPALLPAMDVVAFAPAAGISLIDGWRRGDDRLARWVCAGLLIAVAGAPALSAVAMGVAIWLTARIAIVLPANDNASPLGPQRLYPPTPRA